jgi:nicotinate-nucleotide adenylyltransferase
MPQPSYTVDTLTYLTEKNPEHEFFLIIGSDNLPSFHKWKNHQVILERYGLKVYIRPGHEAHALFDHPNVEIIEAPLLDISATFIRKRVKQGLSIRYLVPDAVVELISGRKFYQ